MHFQNINLSERNKIPLNTRVYIKQIVIKLLFCYPMYLLFDELIFKVKMESFKRDV